MLPLNLRKTLACTVAATAFLAASSSAWALNPQPLPPGHAVNPIALNPQPLPPIYAPKL
jgi:hypothetical protein